ncbi:MAG: hypothetical protein WC247_15265 [Porticoccaceae bacterium]
MNKVIAAVALCALFAPLPSLAEELIIAAEARHTVTPEQMSQSVERLVVGDNAVIDFAAGVTHWELLARDATIGHGVVIDARGVDGVSGGDGASYEQPADACRAGKNGVSGEPGAPGERGVDIYLGLDAHRIGGLEIRADGGAGGAGGAGGKGQDGGKILNCNPANGGNGGGGGDGGAGGGGANVVVSVNPLDADVAIGALTAGVRVSVKPGKGGKAGGGGDGGAGSEGQYIKMRTLTGSQKWVAGGRSGRSGAPGGDGEEGQYGQVFVGGQFTGFQPQNTAPGGFDGFNSYRPAAPGAAEREAAAEEIRLLREQLKALQDRMEKLEKP